MHNWIRRRRKPDQREILRRRLEVVQEDLRKETNLNQKLESQLAETHAELNRVKRELVELKCRQESAMTSVKRAADTLRAAISNSHD